MRYVVLVVVVLAVGAVSAAAAPPQIAQGTVSAFANGAGQGVVTQLSQAAPNGVLIETELPAGAAGVEPCQASGAASWWYDPAAYQSGADYEYGQGAGPSGEPAFVSGTSYAVALPPEPPFSFSGVLPPGPQSCSQSVAFVIPADGRYRLEFTAGGGSLTFNVSPEQLAGQGPQPLTITRSVAITQELTPGVWSINLNDGSSGTTSWTISGAAEASSPGTTTTPPTPSAPPPPTITGLKPVRLAERPPTLRFTTHVSHATALDVVLLGANGRKLAHWTVQAGKGRTVASLVLPAAARHPGRDRVRITEPQTSWRTTLAVTVGD
jgi:hypothetical protein